MEIIAANHENLPILPNDLFEHDQEAEERLPRLIRDVPAYKIESLLERFPLLKQYEQVRRRKTITRLTDQIDGGIVLGLMFPDQQLAMKIMRVKSLPVVVMNDFLDVLDDFNPRERQLLLQRQDDTINDSVSMLDHNYVLMQVGAQHLGHAVEPDYVDKPLGIFTYNSLAVCYMMPFQEGSAISISPLRHGTNPVISNLVNHGVYIDMYGKNYIVPSLDDLSHGKLIDIWMNTKTLTRDVSSILETGGIRER